MTTRRQLLAGSVALAAFGAIGCDRRDRVDVRFGIAPGTQTLWRYLVVNDLKLLRPRGIFATYRRFAVEQDLQAAYRAGEIDVIATLLPAIPALAETGTPSQLFGPIAWIHEGYPIVAWKDGEIVDLKTLSAGRLAILPLSHPGTAFWRALLLANHGLRLESIGAIESPTPEQLLVNGQADAAMLSSVHWAQLSVRPELQKLADLQGEWRTLTGSSRLAVFAGYAARPEFLAAHPGFAADLIDANRQGLVDYKRDPAAFAESIVRVTGHDEMTAAQTRFVATYLGYDEVEPDRVKLDDQDVADGTRLFGLLAEAGYLKSAPADPASFYYRG